MITLIIIVSVVYIMSKPTLGQLNLTEALVTRFKLGLRKGCHERVPLTGISTS